MISKQNRKPNSNQINWVIDLIAFLFFFLISAPQATGIPIHEWLSMVFLGTFVVHVVAHWSWIIETEKRLITKASSEIRFNYVIDLIFFLSMIVAFLSGILISESVLPILGIILPVDPFWMIVHNLSGNLCLLLLAVHLAMHWKWIVNSVKNTFNKLAARNLE